MTTVVAAINYLVYLYLLFLLTRLVIDWTRQFARRWRPSGVVAVGLEIVYLTTDPPLKALRRVLPPLSLGGVSLDLSFLVVLIVVIGLHQALSSYAT